MVRASMILLVGAALLAASCGGPAPATQTSNPGRSAQVSIQPSVGSTAGPPSASPETAEFPGLALKATITGVAFPAALVATDGAVWALGHTDARWSVIDPATNSITATVSVGGSYATGGVLVDKYLWALDFTDQQVVAVDPVSRKVTATIPVGIDGGWLVGGDGWLWAIGNDAHDLIRIDPATHGVARLAVEPDCGSTPLAAGGFVWLVSGSGHLCKLDPKTGQTVATLDGLGAVQWLFWGAGRVILPNDEGGAIVVDPTTMTIESVVPPPPPGTFEGAEYSLSSPGSQDSVSMLDAKPDVWVRYTGATVGRLHLSDGPTWTVFAGLPSSNDGAPMLVAFDSFWAADVDGGAVVRTDLPTP